MRLTFLGTGTSVGVPMIGCRCAVCTSPDPRNRRRRSSLYVEAGGVHLVVDTPPDFREQALLYRIEHVSAVLFTHAHADHIFGFDDIRRFNTIQDELIPAYGAAATIAALRRVFHYVQRAKTPGTYRPLVEFHTVSAPFHVGGVRVEPVPVAHGNESATAYRFDCDGRSAGYAPDCSGMDTAALDRLRGVDLMILDGLRHRPHTTHLTVRDSIEWLQRIGAHESYLTHIAHDLDHEKTQHSLPPTIYVACDGLVRQW